MEIKMSTDEANQNVAATSCVNMESVNRIAKLPVVESTLQTATSIYGKVKDYNNVTQWTLATAENTVHKAVEIGKPYAAPVVSHLERPIKKVDELLCTGLDYVEEKVPAVKLPPGEMYTGAKDYVSTTVGPAVQTAKNIYEPTVETAKKYVEPAVESAKHIVEPAVQSARNIVQPAVDTACAIKDYGTHKIDEYLHPHKEGELEKFTEKEEVNQAQNPQENFQAQ